MRQVLSMVLALGPLTQMAASGADTTGITAKIAAMPVGNSLALRLKNQERTRGARGAISNAGLCSSIHAEGNARLPSTTSTRRNHTFISRVPRAVY